MIRYRATFVRINDKNDGAKLHPTFISDATDDETLRREAAKALQAIPHIHLGDWELKAYKPEGEKPKKKTRAPLLWETATEEVIKSILGGEYTPGSQLPAPQQLSTKLDIGASSIYRAYNELRERGWVSVSHQGTFVRERSSWPKHANPPPPPEPAAREPGQRRR